MLRQRKTKPFTFPYPIPLARAMFKVCGEANCTKSQFVCAAIAYYLEHEFTHDAEIREWCADYRHWSKLRGAKSLSWQQIFSESATAQTREFRDAIDEKE